MTLVCFLLSVMPLSLLVTFLTEIVMYKIQNKIVIVGGSLTRNVIFLPCRGTKSFVRARARLALRQSNFANQIWLINNHLHYALYLTLFMYIWTRSSLPISQILTYRNFRKLNVNRIMYLLCTLPVYYYCSGQIIRIYDLAFAINCSW